MTGKGDFDIHNVHSCYVETVTLLPHQSKEHVIIGIDTEEVVNDNSLAAPTYKNIKEWIFETYGVKMHTAYIAQVKRKYGLPMRECSHKSKDKDYVPQVVSVEQEQMIVEALKHFKAILCDILTGAGAGIILGVVYAPDTTKKAICVCF